MDGKQIKTIRGKLTQGEFAELLGLPSVRTLQDWEQDRHAPNSSAVALLNLAKSGALKKRKR